MALPPVGKDALVKVMNAAGPLRTLSLAATEGPVPPQVQPHIHDMLMAMQETQFMPVFDWQAEFKDKEGDLQNPDVVNKADLDTLRKIMTAHVRIDRMSDGTHLQQLIASGYWAACLARINALSQTM